MTNTFVHETEKLIRWHNKGLITKKEALRRFKLLLSNKQGKFNVEQWEKDKASNRVLKDRLNKKYNGGW